MFIAKSVKESPILLYEHVRKHGSHDQSTHNPKKGGGGAGGGSVGSVSTSPKVPQKAPKSLMGNTKADTAVNSLPQEKKDSAYVTGWQMGAMSDSQSEQGLNLFRYSNTRVLDTIAAVENNDSKLNDNGLIEAVRAVGVMHGMMSSQRSRNK